MILSCSNICKSFGSDDIIKNASFHIEDHEKAAIVGINGAGKSTLLKIIVGELQPDSGEVVLDEYEKVLANPFLEVLEVVEDELILALPFLPSHEDCEAGQRLLDEHAMPAEKSPFAILEKLKKD